MTGRAGTTLALALFAVAPAAARADDKKVEVVAEVVHATNEGNAVDPPSLAKMRDELARNGINFTALKRVSHKKVALEKAKAQDVALPDGRNATLTLSELKEGVATVRVKVPQAGKAKPLVDTTYQPGRTGSAFFHAGEYRGGVLVLVLSPP